MRVLFISKRVTAMSAGAGRRSNGKVSHQRIRPLDRTVLRGLRVLGSARRGECASRFQDGPPVTDRKPVSQAGHLPWMVGRHGGECTILRIDFIGNHCRSVASRETSI